MFVWLAPVLCISPQGFLTGGEQRYQHSDSGQVSLLTPLNEGLAALAADGASSQRQGQELLLSLESPERMPLRSFHRCWVLDKIIWQW